MAKKLIVHAPIVRHTAARIKAVRKECALSQTDLAKRAGISLSYLARVELGQSSIGIDMLGRIADALNVQPEVLISGVSGSKKETLVEDIQIKLKGVLKFNDSVTNKALLITLNHFYQSLARQK